MTALLTRLRPSSSHGLRIRLPHRGPRTLLDGRNVFAVFAEAQERLATRSEIDSLQALYVAVKARSV